MENITIRPFRKNDLTELATLHRDVFTDYFLTHLGQGFLAMFYGEFVNARDNYGFVAQHNGKIIGFSAGTFDCSLFYRHFYRANLLRIILTVLGRFIVDPYIRKRVWSRLVHVRYAFSAFLRRPPSNSIQSISTQAQGTNRDFSLLSIGVSPTFRGQRVADILLQSLCQQVQTRGANAVSLSVLPDNCRAIAFYKKNGLIEIKDTGASCHFWLQLT